MHRLEDSTSYLTGVGKKEESKAVEVGFGAGVPSRRHVDERSMQDPRVELDWAGNQAASFRKKRTQGANESRMRVEDGFLTHELSHEPFQQRKSANYVTKSTSEVFQEGPGGSGEWISAHKEAFELRTRPERRSSSKRINFDIPHRSQRLQAMERRAKAPSSNDFVAGVNASDIAKSLRKQGVKPAPLHGQKRFENDVLIVENFKMR